MNVNFKTALWVLFYAILAGGSLSLFSLIPSLIKYIFSLLTIYIGIRFFRRFETIGLRIVFIVLSIIMYFLFVIIVTAIQFIMDNPDLFQNSVA
ncbi:hypothetical protein J40TS1_01250 [Paenibacillus montaniterrae]|uniref:Uncharacterized protein n=1 Tax=Paenibacillus montaniterrae TaxID=429341 RepID=A0A920CWQ3_9BACL|nr:hypothetical protein [Paenibacillus montaniterrae]GIP14483.1 hypothetical protein J40TS1_01250 [Paenibacillus montaniterrae]